MPKLSKADKKALSELVLIRPRRRGKIDPRLIRKALIAVRDERLKAEAEAKALASTHANGTAEMGEAE